MSHKLPIMIVDDEPANRKLLEVVLAPKYTTITCNSGQECLDQLTQEHPEIILLDVMMPDLNGYEVCSRIKENAETAEIPIVFISALDTLDDRLNGYNAGGDDYLGKPVDLSILLKKIELILANKQNKQQLEHDVEEMQSGFMNALNAGEEFGHVTHFTEHSLLAKNYDQLFNAVFESMKNFDLETAAQIRDEDQVITLNSNGESLPLEKELMLKAQFNGQVLEFGSRMFISFAYFSLLVKNVPDDDPDRIERLKEHLSAIAKVCNLRVQAISSEQNVESHKETASLIESTSISLEELNKELEIHIKKAISIAQTMGQKIIHKDTLPDLNEVHREELMAIINHSTEECNELGKHLQKLMNEQNTISDTLQKITKKMNTS